jgi:choice-of-anchor C domain-containing protein
MRRARIVRDLVDPVHGGIKSLHMLRPALVAVLACAAFAEAAGPPQQAGPGSLIVNGSFEDAPPVRTFLNIAGGTTSLKGWQVTGEGIDLVHTNYWQASDGMRSVDLDGSVRSRTSPPYSHGGVAQTFSTTSGTRYLVTFDMAGNTALPPAMKPMRVSAADQSMEFAFDITGKSFRNMGWLPKSWTFTARGVMTTLEFRSLTVSPQTGYGPAIDNVSVTALDTKQPLSVIESEKEIQISLGAEVLFDSGSFSLKPAAADALQKVAVLLKSYGKQPIAIAGHTDSVGRPEANQVLSENRAAAVKDWLTSQGGVEAQRISTKGYGQTAPAATNDTAEGRQKNRRVEIRVQKAGP